MSQKRLPGAVCPVLPSLLASFTGIHSINAHQKDLHNNVTRQPYSEDCHLV